MCYWHLYQARYPQSTAVSKYNFRVKTLKNSYVGNCEAVLVSIMCWERHSDLWGMRYKKNWANCTMGSFLIALLTSYSTDQIKDETARERRGAYRSLNVTAAQHKYRPLGGNIRTTIELKNIITSDSNGTLVSWNIPR